MPARHRRARSQDRRSRGESPRRRSDARSSASGFDDFEPPRGGEIVVAVRVRPFSAQELRRGDELVVRVEGSQVVLLPPTGLRTPRRPTPRSARSGRSLDPDKPEEARVFHFDHSYWSLPTHLCANGVATQQTVFSGLGSNVLAYALKGYNTCLFAYGQTGSGKTFSMVGEISETGRRSQPIGGDDFAVTSPLLSGRSRGEDSARSSRRGSLRLNVKSESRGLMLRVCEELWSRIHARPDVEYKVEVSYFQIYLERVQCLLNHRKGRALRVREHPATGPYVEDLTSLIVGDRDGMLRLIEDGNRIRRVSSTRANHISSRSHAVFCISIVQTPRAASSAPSRMSKISLVDLAGSERVVKSGATGHGLVEAGTINCSLTTLGKVISTLYEIQIGKAKCKHVPYRDSVLTWLLRESLGGNSFTTMLSTVSPSESDYDETLSTLRYSDQAKRIVNKAVVNENNTRRIISQLKGEIRQLESQLARGANQSLADQLMQSQKLMDQMSRTWEEKWAETQAILREKELETQRLQAERDEVHRQLQQVAKELQRTQQQRDQDRARMHDLEGRLAELLSRSREDDWPLDGSAAASPGASTRAAAPPLRRRDSERGSVRDNESDRGSSYRARSPAATVMSPLAASRRGDAGSTPILTAQRPRSRPPPQRHEDSDDAAPSRHGSSARVRAPTPMALPVSRSTAAERKGRQQDQPDLRGVFDALARRHSGDGAARRDVAAALRLRSVPGGSGPTERLLALVTRHPSETVTWEDFEKFAREALGAQAVESMRGGADFRLQTSDSETPEETPPTRALSPPMIADAGLRPPARSTSPPPPLPYRGSTNSFDKAERGSAASDVDDDARWRNFEMRRAKVKAPAVGSPPQRPLATSPPRAAARHATPQRTAHADPATPGDGPRRSGRPRSPTGRRRGARSRSRHDSSSDDGAADSHDLEFRRRCRMNTREAVRDSERIRQRIDDDWRRQQLGLPVPDRGPKVRSGRGGTLRCRFARPHVTSRVEYDVVVTVQSDDDSEASPGVVGWRRRR